MRVDRAYAYAGTALGLGASLGANVLHVLSKPDPSLWAVVGAGFWPCALLVSSEVLARKQWASKGARAAGVAGVLTVAAVAAWISYVHTHGLLVSWGEPAMSARLGPLAIDGLMIVSSLALVAQDAPSPVGVQAAPAPAPAPAPIPVPVVEEQPAPVSNPAPAAPSGPVAVPSPRPRRPRSADARTDEQLVTDLVDQGMVGASQRAVAAHLRVSQQRAGRILAAAASLREAS